MRTGKPSEMIDARLVVQLHCSAHALGPPPEVGSLLSLQVVQHASALPGQVRAASSA